MSSSTTVELSPNQWEQILWGSYCYGLGANTPEDCNTDELLMIWTFCGQCSYPGGGKPFIFCRACFQDFGRNTIFRCVACHTAANDFIVVVGDASAEFVGAGAKARAWAEYVPRKERRRTDRKSLVKVWRGKGSGRHRG